MAIKSYIGQVTIGSDTSPVGSTLYGICGTAAATADKTVKTGNSGDSGVLTAFDNLATGVTIHVKFTNGNTATAPTLSVGTMNTKPQIKNPNGTLIFAQNSIISLTYDGTDWVVNASQATPGTVEQTYDSSNRNAISGAGVANAFTTLTDTLTGTPGAGQTITAFEQVNGKVVATFDDISITKSRVSDLGVVSKTADGLVPQLPDETTATKYLRQDGNWVVPPDNKGVTSITPGNGLINGTTGSSQAAITKTGTISIANSGVTNDMLAGSIAPEKLADNATIGIGTQSIKVGDSFNTTTLLQDLSLSSAMHYKGEVAAVPPASGTYIAGDVVTLQNTVKEYVYDGTNWRELGTEGSYKVKQSVVSDPTVPTSGITTATAFIDTITQDINGNITVTKKNVAFPVTAVAGQTGNIIAATLKTALGLDNNSLHATTGTKGDIIYWSDQDTPARLAASTNGYVLTLENGAPAWKQNAATDKKVEQKKYTSNTDSEFRLLFKKSANNTDETDLVYYSDIDNKNITYNPSTGTLTAAKFSGNGSGLTGITTDHISGTGTGTKYLRQDGWKTLSISYDDASNGKVITGFTFSGGTLPSYTQGTKASASVSNGVLAIVNQGADTFDQGSIATLTNILRTNVAISAS